MRTRYRKMEDQKPWPGFSHNQDFAEGKGLTPKVKMPELEEALSKLELLKRIIDGVWGQSPQPPEAMGVWRQRPQPLGNFLQFFRKNRYFDVIKSHFARF